MDTPKKNAAFFPVFFWLIGLLFVGILIYAYRGTQQANPVMLDEQGHQQDARHA